jgi:Cu/Zn superoxide dismutase
MTLAEEVMNRNALGWLAGVALALTLALGATGGSGVLAQGAGATAVLRDGSGSVLGTVTLSQSAEGVVASGQLRGLQPGLRGVHLHEVGRCEAPSGAPLNSRRGRERFTGALQ